MSTKVQLTKFQWKDVDINNIKYPVTYNHLMRWGESLINEKSDYYQLPWNIIEKDLSNNIINNIIARKCIYCRPTIEMELDGDDKFNYTSMRRKMHERTESILDDSQDINQFIIWNPYSPLSLAFDPTNSKITCLNYHTNVNKMMDCVKILKLLIRFDIIDGIEGRDDIRAKIDELDQYTSKYREIITEQWMDIIVLLTEKDNRPLLQITMNMDKYEKLQTEDHLNLNDEDFQYFDYAFICPYSRTMPSRTDIAEKLLFRGIDPFRFIQKSDKDKDNLLLMDIHSNGCDQNIWYKWFSYLFINKLQDSVDILSQQDKNDLPSLIAPFIVYPVFQTAKQKMFDILIEYIPMHQDCIITIMQHLYVNDVMLGQCYNKYKDNAVVKAIEIAIWTFIADNLEKSKYFRKQICEPRLKDPNIAKFFFQNFEDLMITDWNYEYIRNLLITHKSDIRLSHKGYYDLLSEVIYVNRYGDKQKAKHLDFIKYMELLHVSPLLTDEDRYKILNYDDGTTLLIYLIQLYKYLKVPQKKEIKYIQCLLRQKEIDINKEVREASRHPTALLAAIHYKRPIICSMLLDTDKIPITKICDTAEWCLDQRPYKIERSIMLKLGKYLENIAQNKRKRLYKNKKRLIKKTRERIRKWLRSNPRVYERKKEE